MSSEQLGKEDSVRPGFEFRSFGRNFGNAAKRIGHSLNPFLKTIGEVSKMKFIFKHVSIISLIPGSLMRKRI